MGIKEWFNRVVTGKPKRPEKPLTGIGQTANIGCPCFAFHLNPANWVNGVPLHCPCPCHPENRGRNEPAPLAGSENEFAAIFGSSGP